MPLAYATDTGVQATPIGFAAVSVAVSVDFDRAPLFGYAVAALSYQPQAVL